jgi:hypothetical protein
MGKRHRGRLAEIDQILPGLGTEYAAVLLRTSGGKKGEFGPIRTRKAQILPAYDSMLSQIQALIRAKPQLCDSLK